MITAARNIKRSWTVRSRPVRGLIVSDRKKSRHLWLIETSAITGHFCDRFGDTYELKFAI